MSIELLQSVAFDQDVLRLLLSLDVLLVEYLEGVRPIRWMNRSNERHLRNDTSVSWIHDVNSDKVHTVE